MLVTVLDLIAALTACFVLNASRTTAPTASKYPARTRSERSLPESPRASSCSSVRPPRTRSSSWSTTACSGRACRSTSTPRCTGGCGRCSRTTSRWPPTTCRSTPTRRSATTRCSPAGSAARTSSRSPSTRAAIGVAGRLPGRRHRRRPSSPSGSRALTGREPLHLDGPARVRSIGIVSGGAADHLGDAIAAGHDAFLTGEPAERVFDAVARGRDPLPRRRPLRDGDVRGAARSVTGCPSGSGSATSFWTIRTQSDENH